MSLKLRVNWPISSWDRNRQGLAVLPGATWAALPEIRRMACDHGAHSQADEHQDRPSDTGNHPRDNKSESAGWGP